MGYSILGNPDEEVNRRSMITNGTTLPILTMIQEVMQQRNPYIQRYIPVRFLSKIILLFLHF